MIKKMMTVDVEDWFNILDSDAVPDISEWDKLDIRFERPLRTLLELFEKHDVKVTFFWLGWFAERYPKLVRECRNAGHEIASHGYAHLLAYKVKPEEFYDDISRSKKLLEDIVGEKVNGFRAAGFSTLNDTSWTFDEIARAGYTYDSSVFPATRGHGGMSASPLNPYKIETKYGYLIEVPQSMMEIFGKRISVFGGGYLRLAPWWIIRRGINHLRRHGRPLVVYVHPREIDPGHPRLKLSRIRRFKCYVNLKTTLNKLDKFCRLGGYEPMGEFAKYLCVAPLDTHGNDEVS